MPPTPTLSCSLGIEHRTENAHKRGCSFRNALPHKSQDDDLALFSNMQNCERDNFLLHTAHDFDDSIAKLRYFSDYKLNINIPVRGESSDLLNADGDKNDYDWLLTPPDTPLFPSLDDDDEPQPINLAPRGRSRSQPIAISKSSSTHRPSRNSASPHHRSPSPRSSSSVIQVNARQSSAHQTSSPTFQRPATPSRRPCTPDKSSTPTPRSTTPTFRRMGSESSGQTLSSGRRGVSPMKTSCGNSSSPKLRAWQSNLPGFPSDVPSNLRTSLSDWSASNTRGSLPASRNGRDSLSKFGRQSISPTASRSVSSSHSHERDRFSSFTRGSAAYLCDDDLESIHSATVGTSTTRKNCAVAKSRAMTFLKKPSTTPYASSSPRRLSDSAQHQMDHHTTPQIMFKSLLSSVPSTTFYAGKANSAHRHIFSRNSSLITSSNTSSEQGASVVPDVEGVDDDQDDLSSKWGKPHGPANQEEIFIFDKEDKITESAKIGGGVINQVVSEGLEKSGGNFSDTKSIGTASESSCTTANIAEVDIYMIAICSRCESRFRIVDVDGAADVCQDCAEKYVLIATGESGTTLLVTQDDVLHSENANEIDQLSKEQFKAGVDALPERSCIPVMLAQHARNPEQGADCCPENCAFQSVILETNEHLADQQPNKVFIQSDGDSTFQQSQCSTSPSLRVDNPEGTGISVLLQRSCSSKWLVVQGKAFSATNIVYSEPSYSTDNTSAMKCCFSRSSGSASSSIDLGSSRQSVRQVQHQLSSRRGEIDNMRSDYNEKPQSSGLHSRAPLFACEVLDLEKGNEEENLDSCSEGVELMSVSKEHECYLGGPELCAMPYSSSQEAVAYEVKVLHAGDCMATEISDSQLSNYPDNDQSIDASEDFVLNEDCSSSVNSEKDGQNSGQILRHKEVIISTTGSSGEDDVSNGTGCQDDISNAAAECSLFMNVELQNDHVVAQGSNTDYAPSLDSSNVIKSYECPVSMTSEMEVSGPVTKILDHVGGVYEESTVKVESWCMSRSLTLEEVTGTILFCSSIIHDLAYKAAIIGMEKELALPEAPRPTVNMLGKSVLDQQQLRTISRQRKPKSQKPKRKRSESDSNILATESEGNVKAEESRLANPEVPDKVDNSLPPKLESKCNCTVM